MNNYRHVFVCMLLLLVTLTAMAQESFHQGCRRGTPRSVNTHLRRGGSEDRVPGGDFYKGDLHQLVVLAAFEGRGFKGDETATLEQWNMIFNTENLTETPFKGSIHDYFCAQSYNQFRPVFDLVYVQVGEPAKYASTYSDDENSQYLVQDAIEVLKQNSNINWSLYDWNGDGYVNQVLIIYAGHGMNDSTGDNLIWPHQWWMSEHMKDPEKDIYCDPIPVTYGDKQYLVDCYCALEELTRNDDYGSFGTICHEYSHCFGFPDFYNGSSKFVYGWDLMDSGNYNGNGFCPASYSAHERWLMQWLTPVELKEATTITNLPSLASEGKAYFYRNDGCKNEYYFVENRQKEKWDANLPGSGLVIFHIDYDPSIWTSTHEPSNSFSKQRYKIFYANNSKEEFENWAYPYLASDSLTNNSSPAATLNNDNNDGTKLMNKSLRDINVEGGLASFRFTIDNQSTGIDKLEADGKPRELYRIGPVSILRYPNGAVRKIINPKP